ncbi:MAG: VWA domain-containing protein [Rhodococcus sp.]|nr:VWA domain-containing protein [Rhodococcus sp. (in: high G+C Gram-positive bacteria)]
MSGRHTEPEFGSSTKFPPVAKYGALAVVAVLLVGVAVFVVSRMGSGCEDPTEYTVAADPAIAAAVQKVAADSDPSDLGCASFTVSAVEATEVTPNGPDAPDLWIPDSTMLVAEDSGATVVSESVASTPTVLVTPEGGPAAGESWLGVLQMPGLTVGAPQTDGAALAPIAGATVEVEVSASDPEEVSDALVKVAQQSADSETADAAAQLNAVREKGGATTVTEQQFVTDGGDGLTASVPGTGSIFLDYPLVATGADGRSAAEEAGTSLAAALTSPVGEEVLSAAGFRSVDRSPLSNDRGVRPVVQLRTPEPAVVAELRSNYTALVKPSRTLIVEDVSGSMSYNASNTTRMGMTVRASVEGSKLFPDAAQIGLWSFSTGPNSNYPDYTELVPIARMDKVVDGATQRERLVAGIRSLPNQIGGGTGLYDTTLAAFREVKEGYDPSAVNSVVILTDGSNDDPGSIGLGELLATLEREQDPENPVIVVTIGISEDADADVLRQIAEATGGSSHIARDPSDISTVFAEALQSRGD